MEAAIFKQFDVAVAAHVTITENLREFNMRKMKI